MTGYLIYIYRGIDAENFDMDLSTSAFGRAPPVLLVIFGPFSIISSGSTCRPILRSKKYNKNIKKILFQILKKMIFFDFFEAGKAEATGY